MRQAAGRIPAQKTPLIKTRGIPALPITRTLLNPALPKWVNILILRKYTKYKYACLPAGRGVWECGSVEEEINCQLSAVNRHPSTVNRHPSTVIRHPSTVIRQPSTVNQSHHRISVINIPGGRYRPFSPAFIAPSTFIRASSTKRVVFGSRSFSAIMSSKPVISGFLWPKTWEK
jgi:hypothetical protein